MCRTYLNEKFPFETYAAEVIAVLRFGRCANSAGREFKKKPYKNFGLFLCVFSFLCIFPCVFLKPIKFCSCPGQLSSHKSLVDLLTCAALLLNLWLWLLHFGKKKNNNNKFHLLIVDCIKSLLCTSLFVVVVVVDIVIFNACRHFSLEYKLICWQRWASVIWWLSLNESQMWFVDKKSFFLSLRRTSIPELIRSLDVLAFCDYM